MNRLLRRSVRRDRPGETRPLPALPGRPVIDVTDVSAVLSALDDERRAQRGVT